MYVAIFLILGLAVCTAALADWEVADSAKFASYFILGVLASLLKVTVPAMAGKMSFNFIFILIGIVDVGLAEALLLGCTTAFIECMWVPSTRPTLLQLCFSLANIAVAIACTDVIYHSVPLAGTIMPVRIAVATTAFFVVNTFPMSSIVALSERRSVLLIWQKTYFQMYPFYLTGGVLAWGYHATASIVGWQTAILTLPVAYLLYRTYRLYLARAEDGKIHAEQLASLHLRTIEALALAIEAKDDTTHEHLRRVQVYAVEIGRELGLGNDELEALRAAAVLHDIGKLAVPEHIISKPGKLTPEEFEKMKVHPIVGAEILERVQFPYPVVPIVRAHHEKWNGTGYPAGLRGEEIPIGARILAAVDALDALASDRQYRRALPLDEAMEKIEQDSGRSFDPKVVAILRRRYVELEKKAHTDTVPHGAKLSKEIKVERGEAPAAGFESSRRLEIGPASAPGEDFMQLLADARRDVQSLFDNAGGSQQIDLDETLVLFSVKLKKVVPYEAIAIYFLHEEKLKPRYVAGDNYRLFASLRIPMGQGLSGWVAENRKAILNGNPSVEPGYLNDPSVFSTLRSALAVPLIASNGVIGVLALYSEAREAFSREQLRVIDAIAPKLALSIEHSIRRQSTRHESETSDTLIGIPEGIAVVRQLEAEMLRCRRLNSPLAVVVFSVDDYRDVAARCGRFQMTNVMRAIAMMLRDSCGEFEYVGRMAASEFVLILPGLSAQAVESRMAKLLQVSTAVAGEPLTVAAGAALFPADATSAEQLLAVADRRVFEYRTQRAATLQAAQTRSSASWLQ